jgi:hypothetical protein
MSVNKIYARGLVRRDLAVLSAGEVPAVEVASRILNRELAADPSSRTSPKKFARVVRALDHHLAADPGTLHRTRPSD